MDAQRRTVDAVKKELESALQRVEAAQQSLDAYGFLPAIAGVLAQMLRSLETDRETRDRIAGGLGRLVTDNYSFSESDLGQELLKLADDFALL